MIVSIKALQSPRLNRIVEKFFKLFGDFDTPEEAANLPHGVKFHVEPGVGIFIVPRTKLDKSLEIL